MSTGTQCSVHLEEQMAMLVQRMDELAQQLKILTEDLSARVERVEKGNSRWRQY